MIHYLASCSTVVLQQKGSDVESRTRIAPAILLLLGVAPPMANMFEVSPVTGDVGPVTDARPIRERGVELTGPWLHCRAMGSYLSGSG
jgi:hypothetical protein